MLSKKKIAAVVLGAMISVAGTAFAADGADSFIDVPKDHWSYEALDYLTKEGIVEGMGDYTFQGGRTMTRYEMAAIVYRALQHGGGGDIGAQSVLERLQNEYAGEISSLKQQVDKNTKDIADVKKEQERVKFHGFIRAQWDSDHDQYKEGAWNDEHDRNRFLLNLLADLRINDQWTGHFQVETNQRYSRNTASGEARNHSTHVDKLSEKDWGTIQRVWATGNLKNGVEVNFGRRWAFLGHQFSLLGATVNGADFSVPVTKRGLRLGGFYYNMAEYDNADFDFWGPVIKGPLFKMGSGNLDVQLAYAKLNKGRNAPIEVPYSSGKNYDRGNWIGNQAFVTSVRFPLMRNVNLTADYVQTNHESNSEDKYDTTADFGKNNKSYLARIDYKWTNPEVKHSFAAYARYHYLGRNGTIWADDSWSSVLRNSKGWTVGFRYVPWKNVEWETFYELADCNMKRYSWSSPTYKRHLLRTQMDFHF